MPFPLISRHARLAVGVLLPLLAGAPAPATATTEEGFKIAFVTSTSGFGNLGDSADAGHWVETSGTGLTGLNAADHICQTRAEAVGFATAGSPVFRAWMSDTLDDAWCRVQGLDGKRFDASPCGGQTLSGAGPWVRVDGVPWAPELTEFVDPAVGPWTTARVTETGTVFTDHNFMTGTGTNGVASSRRCLDWTSSGAGQSWDGGVTHSITTEWSVGASSSCSGAHRLLCLEVGSGGATPRRQTGAGALVFRTSEVGSGDLSTWTATGGLAGVAGATAACQALAAAARLPAPESFVPWLSDAALPAKDRITTDGPFRRVDGFLIADTKADLIDSTLDDPFLVDENGQPIHSEVWTGSSATGLLASTCADWTSEAGNGTSGRPDRADNLWSGLTSTCTQYKGLYCVSNVVTVFWDGFE